TTIFFIRLNEDCRLQIKALLVELFTTTTEWGAAFFGVSQEFFDGFPLTGGSQWSKLRLTFGWITRDQFLCGCHEHFDELIEDRLFNKHAAARATVLSGVGKDAHG